MITIQYKKNNIKKVNFKQKVTVEMAMKYFVLVLI